MASRKARKHVARLVKPSFGEQVRRELDEIFRIDTTFKKQFVHLRILGNVLKTRALRTIKPKPRRRI